MGQVQVRFLWFCFSAVLLLGPHYSDSKGPQLLVLLFTCNRTEVIGSYEINFGIN